MRCDDLEGWDGGGREATEKRTHVYIQVSHIVIQQKLTQHCKTIIFQLKKKSIHLLCPKQRGAGPP